jgi:hypothetical protein
MLSCFFGGFDNCLPRSMATRGIAAAASPRWDHVVDKAAARRDEGIGEFLAVFLGARLDCGRIAEIAPKDDLDRALGTHDRDLGRGPGKIDIAAQVLRAHHVIAPP